MERIVRCEADEHHYDANVHSSCPFCRSTKVVPRQQPAETPTVPNMTPSSSKTEVIWKRSAVAPVVGWLVVYAAPKKGEVSNVGRDYRLIPNRNRIGRGSGCEVVIDIGDEQISSDHCAIVYDAMNSKYYLQPGDGRNLTYLAVQDADGGDNLMPVLSPVELKGREHIRIGMTTLVFVPFCEEGVFNWNFKDQV